MKATVSLVVLLGLAAGLPAVVFPGPPALAAPETGRVRHALEVHLDPAPHELRVADTVHLPAGGHEVDFLLNAALRLTRSEPAAHEVPLGDTASFLGINASDLARQGTLKRYRLAAPADGRLVLEYQGRFDFGLSALEEEYTRGFRETAGIVGPQGVYLAGDGFWYPQLGPGLLEFTLTAPAPPGWHLISQGGGTSRDEHGVARWDSGGPMDEIDLVGGPLQVYRDAAGSVETLVYLRERDDALAGKYLQATAQYLEMYRGLIGPYPYGKFALVENFWETGYGMPSFTLLGPQILRFPFILTSSYPHEILHNWWGNSVFVDYPSGNWCEGLTAYLADHLIQEQRGKGEEHRRATLQKYRDYVKAGRDFPLTGFRSRHSAATEAVGYGKTLMVFHMLRRQMGDDAFRKLLARFYREEKGKQASFADIRNTAEAVTGRDLSAFFAAWVERTGAPALAIAGAEARAGEGGFTVRGTLKQVQGGAPYALDVPVAIQTEKGAVRSVVRLAAAEAPFTVRVPERPLALHVDPQFDLFRRLDPRETPASIGQIFGEPRIVALLPAKAPAAEQEAYRKLLAGWQSESHAIDVKLDSEVEALPGERSVWLLGRENRFASRVFASGGGLALRATEVEADGEKMTLAGHSVALTARHPGNVEEAVGWIFADPLAALPGLGRKLPHYGKYSYLGFEGEEPTNVLKGQWSESDSPLRVDLRGPGERVRLVPPLVPEPRKALAELPPVFSQKALLEHVTRLSAPEMEGRGLGSAGHEKAAAYVAEAFKAIDLAPGGDAGGYFQRFHVDKGEDGRPHEVANVIALLPGTKPEWQGQSVIVSAHYDHLGRGWPDVHKGDEGKIHPGADDDASGVAVMLELARAFAAGEKPKRALVFVAFTGEEAGLLGSSHYAEHSPPFPLAKVMGVVTIDAVGRLGDQKLSVLGTSTASEWPHIFRGASFVTGVESRNIAASLPSSDQTSFVRKGVPAVQVFTAAHADYHRPGDTVDKIDAAGLVKVAAFVKEAVAYLAEREQPLTVTIPKEDLAGAPAPSPAGAPGRRVSFGTVPDFAFAGPGVRVEGVVPGSPAAKAGVREGDVLLRIDERPIANLQAFSDVLKTLAPGQTVRAVVLRQGQERTLEVTVAER